MWIPYAFWPTFVASVISIFLVIYIIRADIRKAGNMAAFLMFFSVLIWSIGELIERIAGPPPADKELAYFGARFLFLGIALVSATFIHFAIDYPYRIKIGAKLRTEILYVVYAVSIIGWIIDAVSDFLGHIVIVGESPYTALGQTIWGLDPGIIHKVYATWLLLTALFLLVVLPLKLRNVKMKIVRMQIWFTFIGILIAFVLVTITGYAPVLLGIAMYPLTTISFSIFGVFIIYTIYRYRMFLVVPATEEIEMHEKVPEPGFYTMPRGEAFRRFVNLAKSGHKALGFISQKIDVFREKYSLKATPIFQIAENPGKDKLNPQIDEQREMIPFIISTFMEEVENPVILLDLSAKHVDDKLRKRILNEVREVAGGRGVLIVAS